MPKLTDFGVRAESVDENTHLVAAAGEIDALAAPQLGSTLLGLADEGKSAVVVDLSGVTFIDSVGLGVLVGGRKRARSNDGDLVLVATGRNVLRVLDLTGLTRVFDIHGDREAALAAMS